jgi:hypothetical protein
MKRFATFHSKQEHPHTDKAMSPLRQRPFGAFAEYSLAILFAVDAVRKISQDWGERACLDRLARCLTFFGRIDGRRTLARAVVSRAPGTVARYCTVWPHA